MLEARDDIRLALDKVAFAKELGIRPDGWQEELDALASGAAKMAAE